MADGKSVMQNLGPVTAYAIARKHGFSGTEEEWAKVQMQAVEAGESAIKASIQAAGDARSASASASAAAGSERRTEEQVGVAKQHADNAGANAERAASEAVKSSNQADRAEAAKQGIEDALAAADQSASAAAQSESNALTHETAARGESEEAKTAARAAAKDAQTASSSAASAAKDAKATAADRQATKADAAATAADRQAVATDKANAQSAAETAQQAAATATQKAETATQQATKATQQADRAKSEADRAAGAVEAGLTDVRTDIRELSAKKTDLSHVNQTFANALVGKVSGPVVAVDDVSPVEHEVGCKVERINLYPISERDPETRNGITFSANKYGVVSIDGDSVGAFIFSESVSLPKAHYTMSLSISGFSTDGNAFVFTAVESDESRHDMIIKEDGDYDLEFDGDVSILRLAPNLGTSYANAKIKAMITKKAIDGFVPYVPELKTISVTRCGANRFREARCVQGSLEKDGTITRSSYYTSDYIPVVPGRSVEISEAASNRGKFYNALKEPLTQQFDFNAAVGVTVEIPIGCAFLRFSMSASAKPEMYVGVPSAEKKPYDGTEYTPNPDGTISGMTSLSPDMTILTDNLGVTVNAEYNKDANKVIGNLHGPGGVTDAASITATVPAGLPPETRKNVQAVLNALGKKPCGSSVYRISLETAPAKELAPNTFYVWGEMPSLTVTLGAELPNVVNEYVFQFTSGQTPTTLSVPDTVKWVSGNTIEANKTYQVSIINNIGVIGGA